MAGKKKHKRALGASRVEQKKLKVSLAELRSRLAKTEKKLAKAEERAERWKRAAKEQREATPPGARDRSDGQTAAPESRSEAKSRSKSQTKSKTKSRGNSQDEPVSKQVTAPTQKRTPAAPESQDGGPDQTWTVAQLRAEARSRGLVGMSNKPKAQLLAALTRPGTAAARSSS